MSIRWDWTISTAISVSYTHLESGEKPAELLNQVLLPAINQVGEFFDQGKYFLPQLIASAEAMKNSIEVLEPLLQTGGTEMCIRDSHRSDSADCWL